MSGWSTTVTGIEDLADIAALPEAIKRAVPMAINSAARYGRAKASREMMMEVALAKSYLDARLEITKYASLFENVAVIRARDQPTSLARFAVSKSVSGARKAGGVRVIVKPGVARFMRKAFIVRLNNGNLGLAIRLGKGQKPSNTAGAKELKKGSGVWLLYGPSLDQMFDQVKDDIAPDVLAHLNNEFLRLVDL